MKVLSYIRINEQNMRMYVNLYNNIEKKLKIDGNIDMIILTNK